VLADLKDQALVFGHLCLLPLSLGSLARATYGPLPLGVCNTIIEIGRFFMFGAFGAATFFNGAKFMLIYNHAWLNKYEDKAIIRACWLFSLFWSCSCIPTMWKVRFSKNS
jgi:hypothetical protein